MNLSIGQGGTWTQDYMISSSAIELSLNKHLKAKRSFPLLSPFRMTWNHICWFSDTKHIPSIFPHCKNLKFLIVWKDHVSEVYLKEKVSKLLILNRISKFWAKLRFQNFAKFSACANSFKDFFEVNQDTKIWRDAEIELFWDETSREEILWKEF